MVRQEEKMWNDEERWEEIYNSKGRKTSGKR